MEAELKRLKEELSLRKKLEACLYKLSREADKKSLEDLNREIIKNLRRLTGSPIAAVGIWDEANESWYFPNFKESFYRDCKIQSQIRISSLGGVFAKAFNAKRTYVSNALSNDPYHKGFPEGHLPIQRIAIYPIFRSGKPKGLLAIANAAKRYTRREKEILEKLGEFYGLLLEAKEREKKKMLLEALPGKIGLGFSLWDLRTWPPQKIFSNKDFETLDIDLGAPSFQNLLKKARRLRSGETLSRHLKLENPREIHLICTIKKIDTHLVGLAIQDITRELQIQEELNEAEKVKAVNLLVGNLVHKFNNLLNVIIHFLEILKAQKKDTNIKNSLTKAEFAAQDLAVLVRQLLLYARGEVLGKKPFALKDFVPKVIKFIEAFLPSHLYLKIRMEENLPLVKIDPIAFEQILINLVINAIEAYEGKKGTIGIKIYLTEKHRHSKSSKSPYTAKSCSHKEALRWVAIEVRDRGKGIPPEILPQILEPFYSTKGLGRGLGLAAVRTMVYAHEGCMVISSRPGKGTSFKILLPVNGDR